MRKAVLAVDGSEHSDQAACCLVAFAKQHGLVEVHMANVEPAPIAWQTCGMASEAMSGIALGSVTRTVLHLTSVPVVCVK